MVSSNHSTRPLSGLSRHHQTNIPIRINNSCGYQQHEHNQSSRRGGGGNSTADKLSGLVWIRVSSHLAPTHPNVSSPSLAQDGKMHRQRYILPPSTHQRQPPPTRPKSCPCLRQPQIDHLLGHILQSYAKGDKAWIRFTSSNRFCYRDTGRRSSTAWYRQPKHHQ